jgi:hypothetical protein
MRAAKRKSNEHGSTGEVTEEAVVAALLELTIMTLVVLV